MKKNYLPIIIMLMLSTLVFSQKVTLTPTAVNNTNVNAGPINLASVPNSTISLNIKVEIPSNVAVNDQGTITVYYSNLNIANANVAAGGNGGNLYFGGGKTATRSMVINLYWTDFLTSGGFIFAEYKTTAGTAYRSSNLAVIKNATMTTGTTLNPPADAPNPTKINNTLCCNQTVRLGEKPQPITGSQFSNPYAREPYGINIKWETNGNPLPPNFLNVDNINHSIALDYTNAIGSFTVKRSLGYVYGNQYPNASNTITITVVPSPITYNEIYINSPVNTDGSFEISSSKPQDIFGSRSYINLNVLQNPYYVPKRGDTSIPIDKYEWEYSIVNGTTEERSWNIIPNQSINSLNSVYLPRSNNSKDNFYTIRRIAIYQNLRIASNPLKIWIRAVRENNTICCDQSLAVSSANIVETPSIIKGTTAISNTNKYLFYQWQSQTVTENEGKVGNWTNIPNATSKDYLPPTPQFIPGDGRNLPKIPTYSYRRIATDNSYNGETYYSNEITLTPSTNVYSIQTLKIYPNPATSILNIENTNSGSGVIDLNTASIIITNTMGNIVNSNNFTRINSNLASINISNLINGVYFLTITSNTSSRRTYSEQFTFIKQ